MKEEVKKMREKELIYIIRNEKISIKSEDTIWEIIKERIKEMKKEINKGVVKTKEIEQIKENRRILMENVKVKYLNKTNFKEYIEEIEGEDMRNNGFLINNSNKEYKCERNLWNQIQEIILNNIKNITLEGKEEENCEKNEKKKFKLIEHKEGKNFEGIIKYLEDKYGKDIHQKGIITITASSSLNNRPEQVIDYNWNGYWYSSYRNPGEWWEINFKKMKVRMNGYSLKTANECTNSIHLKNWVIEGRNEGGEWKEIDRQDNYDLNGPSYQHYYLISEISEPYQYIRIKCIGKDHRAIVNNYNDYFLLLNNLEIYGEINEDDQ